MSAFTGYIAPQQDSAIRKLERLADLVTEPGVILLGVLAILSATVLLSMPDAAAQLAQLF
ncbi:MAG TPA: hypothetical protein VKY65_09780 [Alphaproteobacteria bacterium]|nr:hypothetical protein [Alphaproteobacteria bacterium]